MTTSRQPISFIATAAPEASQAFYEDTLGLTLIETSPYALVFHDAGVMLRVQIVPEFQPANHTAHGWQVSDIAQETSVLTAKGVAFLRFEHLDQDARGVWATADGAKIAWFKDPGGNILSLTEFAAS